MKLKYIIPAFIALFAGVLTSCSDDEATYLNEIKVSQSTVAIPVEGGEVTIEVEAADAWAVDGEIVSEWLTVTPTQGVAGKSHMTFKAPAYDAGRDTTIYLTCGGKRQTINIMQGLKKVETVTCAEALNGITGKTYRVTGVVSGIYNTTYGNYYLNDESGQILVYGTLDKKGNEKNFASLGIENGDKITVEGPRSVYNGVGQLVNVSVIKIEKSLIKVVETIPAEAMPVEGGEVTMNLECKGNGVNVEIPEDAKDWLSIAAITSGTTPTVKFRVAANEGGDRDTKVTFKTYDAKGVEYTAEAAIAQKGAIVKASIAEFLAAEVGNTQYRLTGVVSKVVDATKGNINIKDFSGEVYGYRVSGFTGKEGDIVTIVGKRAAYNGTPQIGNGVVEELKSVTAATIAEVLAAEDNNSVYYMVTGTVDEIAGVDFGNVYLKDANGNRIYVYGVYPGWGATGEARKGALAANNVEVGDQLTVIAFKTTFKGNAQLSNGIFFSVTKQ